MNRPTSSPSFPFVLSPSTPFALSWSKGEQSLRTGLSKRGRAWFDRPVLSEDEGPVLSEDEGLTTTGYAYMVVPMKSGTKVLEGSRSPGVAPRFTLHVSRLTWTCLVLFLGLLLPAGADGQTRIVTLSPEKGPTGGGTLVTLQIEGGLALGPLGVEFGSRPASMVRRRGLSTLEAVTPPGEAGPIPVRVVNSLWGTKTDPAVFTYLPQGARLGWVDPASAPVGSDEVRLSLGGERFAAASTLRFGEVQVPTTFVSPERLEARVPVSLLGRAREVDLRVSDPALRGEQSNALAFAVVNPPPHLIGLGPPPPGYPAETLGAGGAAGLLTVRGQGFRPDSQVQIAGGVVETRYRAAGELLALIPAEFLSRPGDLPVTVTTPGPGGGRSNALNLRMSSINAPTPAGRAPLPGRFLVFTSNRRGGRNHLYLLDRETGRLDRLEEANSINGNDGYPSISADGRFIVFQSDRSRGQADLFLFDRRTRSLDPMPEANHPTAFDGFPHISADGRFIVFESDRLNRRPKIFLFDRQTRMLSELNEANEPTADDGLAAISN